MQYFDVDKEMEWYNSEVEPKRKKRTRTITRPSMAGKNNHCARSVVQLTKDGNYVETFETIREAQDKTGLTEQRIGLVAKGKYNAKTTGGYRWMYLEDYNNLIKQTA